MRNGANSGYPDALRRQFSALIDELELDDLAKHFLRHRWLDQLVWFETKAAYNQRRHYALRVLTIVGGVVVPALVSLGVRKAEVTQVLGWVTFSVSLVVALSASLEGFFRYGERWRSFRRTGEMLKAHGWLFIELAGPYAGSDRAAAFTAFAAQVETLVQQDVDAFIAQAAAAQAAQQAPSESGPTGRP